MNARFAQELNSAVSFALIAYGLLLSTVRPLLKEDHKYLWPSYVWWLLQWVAFALVWLVSALTRSEITPAKPVILLLADFGTIATLAFSLTFLKGKKARWNTGLKLWSWTFLVFAFYNVGFYAYMQHVRPGNQALLTTWTAPSQVLSVIGYCAFAYAFLLRYGSVGTLVSFACVIYAILQRPAYYDVFQANDRDPWIALALASGKALLGIAFYSLFFVEAADYDVIPIRLTEDGPKYLKYLPHAAGCFVAVTGAFLVVALLHNEPTRIVTEILLTIIFAAVAEVLLRRKIREFLKRPPDPPSHANVKEMKIGNHSEEADSKSAGGSEAS